MVDWIWRYPLKSAQGESLARVFIGADGPAGDRSWACVTADGLAVSAKNPRKWGRMLYVAATLAATGSASGRGSGSGAHRDRRSGDHRGLKFGGRRRLEHPS